MTTSDYFLATSAELYDACRGWAAPGSRPDPDGTLTAEYHHLTWVDLKPIDTLCLAPLAAVLLGVDLEQAEERIVSPLEGPDGCEQALFVLPQDLVLKLANLTDDEAPDIVARWLLPLRTDVGAIEVEFVRDELLEGMTPEYYLPMLKTLRGIARLGVDTHRQLYLLISP